MNKKIALITGITGMDGSYLSELLLSKEYEVHGIVRRTSSYNTERIDHLYNSSLFNKQFFTHYGDLIDSSNIASLVQKIQPDEIYHLGAQSHVGISFEMPDFTMSTNVQGTLNILNAVRNFSPSTKVYNASTSEMFGGEQQTVPQKGFNENSALNPKSPYGAAKVAAHWLTSIYRQSYDLHASSGFLFNHTSPRRGKNFVCRKITVWFAKYIESIVKNKSIAPIILGNIDSYRDFGHSKDYVAAQWLMLQQEKPSDYVISSGETHSIRELLELCFGFINKKIEWVGSKENEIGMCDGNIVIKISSKYMRPLEVDYLLGDSSKARSILGWEPTYTFSSLFREMIVEDAKSIGLSETELKNSIEFN